MPWR